MAKLIITTLTLLTLALPARAADTLADMDIAITPELYAMGIDVGVKHLTAGEVFHPQAQPEFIRAQPMGPIVILGDSIMAGLGSWPGAINLAVSGTTTAEILQSVARIPVNASRVYIEGGFNNFAIGTQGRIVSDYAAILAGLPKSAKAEVIGILPVNDSQIALMRNASNASIAATDARIAATCGCALVPSPFGKSLPASLNVGDGIHPNAVGQAVLKAAIH